MSTVYKAINKQTNQIIALNHIKSTSDEMRQRVMNEIGIMQLSIHPNIIQYENCFEQNT